MSTIGLIVSLILLGGGMLLLIFNSFARLSFNLVDLVVYLLIGATVAGIIWIVGRSLNKQTNNAIQRFLAGEQTTLTLDKGLLRVFGLVLVTLLPFLIYLFLLALYSTLTVTLLLGSLILHASRIPVAIPIAGAILVFGTIAAIAIGFFYLVFPPNGKAVGLLLDKSEHRQLWELINETGRQVKADPINQIIVTPSTGIRVYMSGSVFLAIFGGGRRTLEIGIPSIFGLNVREFSAILAHEYGHFSHRDTQWGAFSYSMSNSLISTLRAVPGPNNDKLKGHSSGLVQLIVSLNPAYWMLLGFTYLFHQVTGGFSRVREVMADVMAMELFGGNAFAKGLLNVAMNDIMFSVQVEQDYIPKLVKQGKVANDFSKLMDFAYVQMTPEDMENFKTALVQSHEPASLYDSHPPLRTRLNYADRFSAIDYTEDAPVSSLFDGWDELNQRVADLYDWRLAAYIQHLKAELEAEANKEKVGSAGQE